MLNDEHSDFIAGRQQAAFAKARAACPEGRGYTVK